MKPEVAYFTAEICCNPHWKNYSGGLGVLAGDHYYACKDLGIPLTAVSEFYTYGYCQQTFDENCWQHEEYPPVLPEGAQPEDIGLEYAKDKNGDPVEVNVPIEEYNVKIRALTPIGDRSLLLLTTDVLDNSEELRRITGHLYGSCGRDDDQTRVRQEMVLGIGGYRMLRRLGFSPTVYHMNEGHSAFVNIARTIALMADKGFAINEASDLVRVNTLFTCHTLVAAGNDNFRLSTVEREFSRHQGILGRQGFQYLADRANHVAGYPDVRWSQLNFAKSVAGRLNLVSLENTIAAAEAWGVKQEDLEHITNGVYLPRWMAKEARGFINPDEKKFIEYHLDKNYVQDRLMSVREEDLRNFHNREKRKLIDLTNQYRRNEKPLNPNFLTIGYARRAATYKRLDVLFSDPERLAKILSDPERPAQIVIAAKAHPLDDEGKAMIQRIKKTIHSNEFLRGRVCFIEDYNAEIAVAMVKGSDVWVNVPETKKEASGTSGMKASADGVLGWSISTGWQNEFPKHLYFEIKDGSKDFVAKEMYQMLEGQIAPMFYQDGANFIPSTRWLDKVRRSMIYAIPNFSAHRMAIDYYKKYYLPLTQTSYD